MEEYCRDKGFIKWFETSAKENINIDEAAKCLVDKVSAVIGLKNMADILQMTFANEIITVKITWISLEIILKDPIDKKINIGSGNVYFIFL